MGASPLPGPAATPTKATEPVATCAICSATRAAKGSEEAVGTKEDDDADADVVAGAAITCANGFAPAFIGMPAAEASPLPPPATPPKVIENPVAEVVEEVGSEDATAVRSPRRRRR